TVIRAYEVGIAQQSFLVSTKSSSRINMCPKDDEAVSCTGKFSNEVAHRQLAFRSIGFECVLCQTVILQFASQIGGHLLLSFATRPPRANCHNISYVLH